MKSITTIFTSLLLLSVAGCMPSPPPPSGKQPASPAFEGVFIFEKDTSSSGQPIKLIVTAVFHPDGTFSRRYLGTVGGEEPQVRKGDLTGGTWRLEGSKVDGRIICSNKLVFRIKGNHLVLIEDEDGSVEENLYLRQ